jgi:hypothetical protein
MPKTSEADLQEKYLELLQQAQPPDWIREMVEHYRRTGKYRPQDLRRLLGDPTEGVEVGPNTSIAALLAAERRSRP